MCWLRIFFTETTVSSVRLAIQINAGDVDIIKFIYYLNIRFMMPMRYYSY